MCGISCERFVENISDRYPEAAERCSNMYNEYIVNRSVLHGLPVSLIVTMACARFFGCPSVLPAALFATINYFVLTGSVETMRRYRDISVPSRLAIIAACGVLSAVAVEKCFSGALSYRNSFILTVAAFSGQLFRSYFSSDE
jgi:hypothetical protein